MNHRASIIGAASVVCLAVLTAAFVQHRQLANLRADQQRLLDQAAPPADGQSAQPDAVAPSPGTAAPDASPSSELLKLRNQVSQLTGRKRQLFNVRAENERLRAQLATRRTNAPAAAAPAPPGFIAKSQAQWSGTTTPENTIQSLLWTLQTRDLTNFLQVLTPESSERFQGEATPSDQQALLDRAAAITGIAISGPVDPQAGAVDIQVQWRSADAAPPTGGPVPLSLRQINGQWKVELR